MYVLSIYKNYMYFVDEHTPYIHLYEKIIFFFFEWVKTSDWL